MLVSFVCDDIRNNIKAEKDVCVLFVFKSITKNKKCPFFK